METETTPVEERRADPPTQLEIDEGILDYLAYKATRVLLLDFQKSSHPENTATWKPKAGLHLDLVDSFLVMFRAMHPAHQGTPELQLRLRLLKFVTLFTKRQPAKELRPWMQGLESLRHSRQEKANTFKSMIDVPELTEQLTSSEDLKWIKQEHVLGPDAPNRPKKKTTASLPLVSLLDTIPSFMALSAAENAMQESKITDTWMRLAAGYMAQAVVEQYLIYGSQSHEVLKEAFAWGFDSETAAEEGSDDWLVNAMFLDEDAEFESWHEIRNEHMQALIPQGGGDLLEHLRDLRENELSLPEFEHTVLQFLTGLLHSIPSPLLIQMESARIEHLPCLRHDT